jgi:hypothetical protein
MNDGKKNGKKRARGLDDDAMETTSASKRQCVTLKTTTGETYEISLEVLQQHGEGSEYIKTMLHALLKEGLKEGLKERKDSIEFPGHPLIPLLLSGNLGEFKTQLFNLLQKKDKKSREECFSLAMEIIGINMEHLSKVFCKVLLVDWLTF